jgi:hypothetical protein
MPEQNRPDVILVKKVHQKYHDDGTSTVTGLTRDLDEMDVEE